MQERHKTALTIEINYMCDNKIQITAYNLQRTFSFIISFDPHKNSLR